MLGRTILLSDTFTVLACYAKHQIGQKGLFHLLTLLQFSCLLCKTPNRSRRTLLSSDTFTVRLFIFSSELDGNYRDRLITLPASVRVLFARVIV